MSCFNITPLVLSDTFNTWFERTNELIDGLNGISTKGISASSYSGIKLTDDGNCFYDFSIQTGPFLGFVTSGPTSDYGSGTPEDPYRLTLLATGPTMSPGSLTADDYAFVSDTSDASKIKLAPVSSFITNINGGSNISVVFDSGTNSYTISYVELSFNPVFNSIQSGSTTLTTSSTSVYEAIANNSNSVLNGTLTYTISDGGNVDIASVSFKCNNTDRISGDAVASGNGSGTFVTGGPVKVPHNVATWFNVDTTTISFNAGTTSDSVANDGTTIVSPLLTDSDTKTAYFGWRFGGCASNVEYTTAAAFSSAGLISNLNQMTIAGSNPPWEASSPSNRIYRDPTIIRPFRINISTGGSYIYFVHSSTDNTGNSDNFGWSPRLYNDAGTSEITNGLVEIGVTQIGDGYYRVWRSSNTYLAGNLDFNIGGNKHGQ